MTLLELSKEYRQSSTLLRIRLRELRQQERAATDAQYRWQLQRRIAALKEMQRQVNELTILTSRYYERSYHKNEKYTL